MFHRRLVLGALLLAGVIGCEKAGSTTAVGPPDGATEAFVTVRTELARRGAMSETVEGLGRCEALPDHIATLTPAVEGHVHELFIKQGDPVKKGQPIVELDETVAPSRPGRENSDSRRAQSVAGRAQVATPPRGAAGQRAGGRTGQGGGRTSPGRRRGAPIAQGQ